MPKIKFTAFATNANTGERGHGSGETTVSDKVLARDYEQEVRQGLTAQGYKDVIVHINRVEG
jgi:hypothetical protein